ncbi:hypothetical protein DACRYDRAFT_25461 [Dacryopinax primogenitus]|uniref:DUF302 domain-containing protein n=1 Tax=Dacryopinax primogenitus (strain DJM 731) TaxID=1858805 RepID=M5FZ42_DACPD|nr:uncharacterized protein DACRYDRAFT_25461 [Dacryopinax primogenitus]EJT96757.1 hypothetical protein DACRYDRAFT_25461 [Dacryopinax primogenitus]
MATKSSQSYTAQRITLRSPTPFYTVLFRLEKLTNHRAAAGLPRPLTSKVFETWVEGRLGESGFMFFNAHAHSEWFSLFSPTPTKKFTTYILGNPLIARTLLVHEPRAGLIVPPRVFLMEEENGTAIVYDLPSSVVCLEGYAGGEGTALEEAARALDGKLERVLREALA